MSDNLLRQTFRIYNPQTLTEIGQELRVDVHNNGDWHLAVTAFIFRQNDIGQIEVLVQERSQYVDIAQKHFDQSLATQLVIEDQGDTDLALSRGLLEELGINDCDVISKFKWNQPGSIFISKEYSDNPELWNREIVVNYCIQVTPDFIFQNNFKVKGTEWLPWSEFCDLVRMQPNNFTKSVRIFSVADSIAAELHIAMKCMIEKKAPAMFSRKLYYLSLYSRDVVVVDSADELVEMYKTNYTMRKVVSSDELTGDVVKRAIFEERRGENDNIIS